MTSGAREVTSFDDIRASIAAEFAAADPVAVRDLTILRFACESALNANDMAQVARCQRLVMSKEREIRDALRRQKRDGSGPSLRSRLEARYANAGSRPP